MQHIIHLQKFLIFQKLRMSSEITSLEEYNNDKRHSCKYGLDCYQKNQSHHAKYKHPPKPATDSKDKEEENAPKKRKLNSSEEKGDEASSSQNNDESATKNSRQDPKEFIKDHFLIEMPPDFYQFWDFCTEINAKNPSEALKNCGLLLVGTYDVLAGRFANVNKTPEEYLLHWRYFYDPPEFQTVLKGDDSLGYHIGYFFDSPNEPPAFLACNSPKKNGEFTKMGDNIFAAVNFYLEEAKTRGDPFKKMAYSKLQSSLKRKAEQLHLSLSQPSARMKERERKVVTKTWNKIGLVVPYDKKTELGYRDLAMDDAELKTLLNKLQEASDEKKSQLLSQLQPVLTFANIALDECDFGTGVKLGWNILAHGIDSLNFTISRFLGNSYELLKRDEFAQIARAHLSQRKRGADLSII